MAALDDIVVLDLGGTVATGYCGKLFADHGATVINVEPQDGFSTRKLPPFVDGEDPERSALHAYLSTNKQSAVADASNRSAWLDIVARADVVLSGDPGQEADEFRDELLARAASSDLVLSAVTWFGDSGPYARFRGSDAVCHSLCGLVKGIGKPGEAPLLPSGFQARIIGGLTAFIATMTYVLAREMGNSAGATQVDTSIFEANTCFTEVGAVGSWQTGYKGGRWGVNRFPPTYPLGIYPCRDGWLGVTALTPSQWLSFCNLLELHDQAADKRYLAVYERLRDADALDPLIADKLKDLSADELFHRGQQARIPLAPVPTMEELFGVDQYVERSAFATVNHDSGAAFMAPVAPFRLFRTPATAGGRVASLGADTGRVLAS